MANWFRDPHNRVRASWVVLIMALVGWPTSALTIAANEPQFVLGLSWFAVIQSAFLLIVTTDIRERDE